MIWGKMVVLLVGLLCLGGCLIILSNPGRTGSPSSAPYQPEVQQEPREQPTPSLFRLDAGPTTP